MESKDGDLDINCLKRGLLSENGSREDCEAEGEAVFYTASFEENEENFVKYQQPNRIENVGLRRSPSDDVQIQGVANPHTFRKVFFVFKLHLVLEPCILYIDDAFHAVMTRLSNVRSEALSRQVSTIEDVPNLRIGHSERFCKDCNLCFPSSSTLGYQEMDPLINSRPLGG
ncbi:hypothetical protein Acr_00g0057860 [Actinidia rufa]|uniref:DUF7642 domain-containing protein n=1 Tax=Actinidia rufa TaxID=165716 RepID=A0A7J0DMX8_9ERIC|nr:hypothetical protein Acr_00g0057860 [Actinidia rufa]